MTLDASPRPDLLDRLRAHPAGRLVLELEWPEPVFLVGGAVRDLLLGNTPVELDVVVEGDAEGYARRLAESADGSRPEALHERFATATVLVDGLVGTQRSEPGAARLRVDVARARAESYGSPGALPEVRPAPIEEDVSRRDFTVNAMAVRIAGRDAGELLAPAGSLEDLEAGRMRVLHGASFQDDPTRLLRLARYASRLSFAIEPETERLARAAVADGALASVSGARLGAELRLALAERDPAAPIGLLAELGVLAGLHPRLRWDAELVRRARALAGLDDARLDLLVLAAVLLALTLRADGAPRGSEARALLDRLEFPAADRDRALRAAVAAPGLIEVLEGFAAPSALRAALADVPVEGVALAGAMTSGGEAGRGYDAARCWLLEIRLVRLRIDGRDLLAAGVPEGPEIGRRLEAALRLRLDGRLPDEREAQLAAALVAE